METLDADVELIKQLEEFQREFSELPCVFIAEGLYVIIWQLWVLN